MDPLDCVELAIALPWSRLHREGSTHRVIPGSAKAGTVFLPEDMKWDGLATAFVLTAVTGFTAWGACVLFMEYWAE